MTSVSLALDCKAVLGESPVCHPNGGVSFVDIYGKCVNHYDSVGGGHEVLNLPSVVCCIVPRAKGGLLAALDAPIIAVNVEKQLVGEELAAIPPEEGGPDFRFNDGKCDPAGRFWVGSMNNNWRDPAAPPGRLYMLEPQPDGTSSLIEKLGLTKLANGLAWTADSRHMYFVDSFYRTIDHFDFDVASGAISNRQTVIKVADSEPGPPDGMSIDVEGKLWVVVGETGSVRQYDPESGREVTRVQLPVTRVTSCAFGGKDLSELYVTSRVENDPSPHAGGLFKCHIPGVKGPSFAQPYGG